MWARNAAQMVECLFTNHKVLSLISILKTWLWWCAPGIPPLCNEFKGSLGYGSNKTGIKNTFLEKPKKKNTLCLKKAKLCVRMFKWRSMFVEK